MVNVNINKFSIAKKIAKNTWPFLVVLLVCLGIFMHIASSPWRDIFLYNGDSLTLPLLAKSIHSGESFKWILSSQIFLFPEGVIYALCYILSPTIYLSLILNSIFILVATYVLLFFIARTSGNTLIRSQVYGVVGVSSIGLYSVLEKVPMINQSSISTLFILNTYYYGVILCSLLMLILSVQLIRKFVDFEKFKKHIYALSIVSILIVGFTLASDPLLLLQFSLPFIVTAIVLWLIAKISKQLLILFLVIHVAGYLLSKVIRIPFKHVVGADISGYINTDNIPQAIHGLSATIAQILSSKYSILEYIIILSIVIFSIIYSLFLIHRTSQSKKYSSTVELLLVIFSAISPVIIVLATVATGSSYTRYFIPIIIFPFISLSVFVSRLNRGRFKVVYQIIIIGLIVLFTAIYIIHTLPKSQSITHAVNTDAITCFDNNTKGLTFNAVGSYWTTRALDLYSDNSKVRVLQVTSGLTPFRWLNNQSSYKSRKFNMVLVDKYPTGPVNVSINDVSILGAPSSQTECADFYIYYYANDNPGYTILNKLISGNE